MVLNNLNYPLDFKFKITTLASDFNITDKKRKLCGICSSENVQVERRCYHFNDEKQV